MLIISLWKESELDSFSMLQALNGSREATLYSGRHALSMHITILLVARQVQRQLVSVAPSSIDPFPHTCSAPTLLVLGTVPVIYYWKVIIFPPCDDR